MSVFEKVQLLGSPERWLVKNKLMDIIKSEDYLNVVEWVINSYPKENLGIFHDALPWSLLVDHFRLWFIYYLPKLRREWIGLFNAALNNCEEDEKQSCGLYWIVHYTLMRAMVDGRVKIRHCSKGKELNEDENENELVLA